MVSSLDEEGQQEGIIKEYKEAWWWWVSPHLDVEMVQWVYAYLKTHKVILFKCMLFILCQLYLNLKEREREGEKSFHVFTHHIVIWTLF